MSMSPGIPIYVVSGQSLAVVRAGWARFMASHLIFGIPATLALFLITLTALRRTQQKDEAFGRLQSEMLRREEAEAALMQRHRLDAVAGRSHARRPGSWKARSST